MRLIDADALKEGIACHKQWTDQEYETDRQWAVGYNAGIDRALFSITYAHTIDAEPVRHGGWVRKDETQVLFGVEWRCSECGSEISTDGIYKPYGLGWKYCYNCGARMGGG